MNLNVDVISSVSTLPTVKLKTRSVAVIDLFRATTVIVNALHNGAKAVVPVLTVEQAVDMERMFAQKNGGASNDIVLGGEREGLLIPGFHLDNSPRAYTSNVISGKRIIFTTTNGTRAIMGSYNSPKIFIASINNASAVARALVDYGKDIFLVCSGTNGVYTLEDGFCAGMIAGILEDKYECKLSDFAYIHKDIYMRYRDNTYDIMKGFKHYNKMLELGLEKDIEHCLKEDIIDSVPFFNTEKEEIILENH